MVNRYADWLRQAEADLRHARNAQVDGDFEWSLLRSAASRREGTYSCLSHVWDGCMGTYADSVDGQLPT